MLLGDGLYQTPRQLCAEIVKTDGKHKRDLARNLFSDVPTTLEPAHTGCVVLNLQNEV